ncbi:hypothetical protein ETU08_08815 [Apibacter muscae]|uniref:Uncharacterized protein n=1 Tax=Apibacter muscae TaxID=2509004 RepID=A0A563DC18_9FLAO|nr:hypothetical protein [Apibacter muscae]TWP23236.1 hypothetical protein ETU10_07740 [Apibacter muscae]TWP27314.1 hypothetical protein ETU09_07670 [Apibacter muscae]TWP28535.1 hypothetical protein ETU08_08815 [Apibacter muscae]
MNTKTKFTIDRLVEFMDFKCLNDNQITKIAGLSIGLIGRARKNKSGLHTDTIEKILITFPELNPTWLLTGKGKMLIMDNQSVDDNNKYSETSNSEESKDKDFLFEVFSAQKEIIHSLKKKFFKTEESLKK